MNTALGAQVPADTAARRQQRALDSLAATVRVLQARVDSLLRAQASGPSDDLTALRAAAAAAADSAREPQPAPRGGRTGQNALNPEISVTGDVRGAWFDPGPQVDTWRAREFEFAFQSALDPFSTAKVYLSVEDGEVGVEEGYVYFTALPGHLRLDFGQFRQQVGELNRWHSHGLPEDEYPLVIRRFAGEEGLVGPGASLYWPVPLSGLGTWELTVQATSGENDVLFAGGRRPAINAQLAGFWQLSRSTFAQVSLSGLAGTNADTNLTTRLGVAAARFSWRPPNRATSREVNLRGEFWALQRTFDYTGPAGFDRVRYGGYADAQVRLSRRWVFSVRTDVVQSTEPGAFATEWAVTPSLTWWQSEFVYARAVWEHARDLTDATSNRLGLQVVFSMGPHKHELF